MKTSVLAYVPVLHQGYIDLFRNHAEIGYILGPDIIRDIAKDKPRFAREIREVNPATMKEALSAALPDMEFVVTTPDESFSNIVVPREDITRIAVDRFFDDADVEWIQPEPFLRWDKSITESEQEVHPDETVTETAFHQRLMMQAYHEAEKSSDWWRQVGAAVVSDREVMLFAHNRHLPSGHSPYALGDPRNNFSAGQKIELSTALHAEAGLIARSAREGMALEGADLYVTTFPCPVCAKSVVEAGFSRVFYAEGYSLMQSQELFASHNIEVIRVLME